MEARPAGHATEVSPTSSPHEVSRAVRATSFGSVAADYDRFRPSPPAEVADWLLPAGVQRVADIGAGTGGFSRVVAARVATTVAVEFDLRMARQLVARSPRVSVVNGRGERLPLRTAGFDAVVASSSWHWLEAAPALLEIARVLRNGGVLGVVWGGPDRDVDWVRELLARDVRSDSERQGRRHRLDIPEGTLFGIPETRVIQWSLPRTPEQLVGLAGTYSRVITADDTDRHSIASHVAGVIRGHRALQGRAVLDLPMSARCWRAVRLPR
ncbi:MAG: class I SAM-dependent methyltransferase [Acidimicrobiales bacterium]